MKATIVEVTVHTEIDHDPDISYLEQDCFNDKDNYGRDRIAAFNRGEWGMVGVVARAVVQRVDSDGYTTGQPENVETSLWGVESDSEKAYFQELGEGLLTELQKVLDNPRPVYPEWIQGLFFDDDDVVWNI